MSTDYKPNGARALVFLGILLLIVLAVFFGKQVKETTSQVAQNVGLANMWEQQPWPMNEAVQAQTPTWARKPLMQQREQMPWAAREPQQAGVPRQTGAPRQAPLRQQVQTAPRQTPAVPVDDPGLIREMGIYVEAMSGGQIKVIEVLKGSWAEKGGLEQADIILRFNKVQVNGLEHFKGLLAAVAPEVDYEVRVLRGETVKKLQVVVGEGDMDGLLPVSPPLQATPAAQMIPAAPLYRCQQCLRAFAPVCPNCARAPLR
ncbi:MAG: PDZ domain-containing protein [Planctomycetes bacterium]|nr:PDZ domain-containing protein [Planctomycetota bacterium]